MEARILSIDEIHKFIIKEFGSLYTTDSEGAPKDVSISNIGTAFIELGFTDRINKIPMKSKNGTIKGQFLRKKFDDGKKDEARIRYKADLIFNEYRFVVTKEMSHLLDTSNEQVNTVEGLNRILSHAVSNDSPEISEQAMSEQKAVYCAIELLFPYSWRKEFLEQKPDVRKIDYKGIASRFGIPVNVAIRGLSTDYMDYIFGIRTSVRLP